LDLIYILFQNFPMAAPKRVAINGFGRIGRLVFRALVESNMLNNSVEVVAVNDVVDADNLAYLLKYDSVHGRFPYPVTAEGDVIVVNNSQRIKVLSLKVTPDQLPWAEHNVDIVIESTGLFTKKDAAQGHLTAGAKKVIISAPSDQDVKTYLVGVNDSEYQGEDLVSNASCTTNCLAPLVKVLLDSGIGLEEGLMTTIHAYTASQMIVDGTSKKAYRDGRAGAQNVIPASTGAAKMIGLVIPEVKGKLTGMSFRVPVADVSCVDLTFRPAKDTSLAEINAAMKAAAEGPMKGVLKYTEDDVVSSDFIHDTHSSVYDAKAGIELNARFFKIVAWYDNEWGYSCRMIDLLKVVVDRMQ
jgi:glyceraldehyde 3-phosphate dehydrogenase